MRSKRLGERLFSACFSPSVKNQIDFYQLSQRESLFASPVAVPEKIFGLSLSLDFFDRGHSLRSLFPPQAALPSLPLGGGGSPNGLTERENPPPTMGSENLCHSERMRRIYAPNVCLAATVMRRSFTSFRMTQIRGILGPPGAAFPTVRMTVKPYHIYYLLFFIYSLFFHDRQKDRMRYKIINNKE